MNAFLRTSMLAFVLFASGGALAQPKPALVQDRDEPARAYYQESFEQTCRDIVCTIKYATVPAGKLLVITWVNAGYSLVDASTSSFAIVDAATSYMYLSPLPSDVASSTHVINSPIQMYVDAGQTPRLSVLASGGLISMRAMLVGYYISVP